MAQQPQQLPLYNLEDVEEAIEAARKDVRYLITDYPIETLVRRFRGENPHDEGDIYVPTYQRTLQWSRERKSYFIESIILRVPIPPIFFYEVKGRLEIVDGSQRIRTLVSYHNNEFSLSDLEKLDVLNGFFFKDLPDSTARRILNTPIRCFVLEQGTDQSTRIELFRRINTSSKQLTEAEIRVGAYQGPFLDMVVRCANKPQFVGMVPGTGTRGNANPESERQELVTRFFIYGRHYMEFVHDVRKFLDQRFVHYNKAPAAEIAAMEAEFDRVMEFVHQRAPNAFYRTSQSKQVPRVRFEAISVGVALALRVNPNANPQNFDWLKSKDFSVLVRTDASNSGPRLRARVEFVRDQILGVL